ncbi:MAG: class I mannose-6-phosphate isomerase [Propionibacteriaceae bacterium]|nr:class I mannose-6-phosphate isomerase [Propionibacteriaceae bacterium]
MSLRYPRSNYDLFPVARLDCGHQVWKGSSIWREIADQAFSQTADPVVAVDLYPGADLPAIRDQLRAVLPDWTVIDVEETAAKDPVTLQSMIQSFLTDDRVFGRIAQFPLPDFYDEQRLSQLRKTLAKPQNATIALGWGATAFAPDATVSVLVEVSRWELESRQRAGGTNWRASNQGEDALRKFKRGFFVEWRTADAHKRPLLAKADFVIDANGQPDEFQGITGECFREALAALVSRPFRVVPVFDPGVWGGQWMRDTFGLDPDVENFAWCFDCILEENSVRVEIDGQVLEFPAMDIVYARPKDLLGEITYARFGADFPIRTDFLDTMGGGNLSLQVHPLTEYMWANFGLRYTQDESYYLLQAEPDATCYLGFKEGVDPEALERDLRAAERGEVDFPAERYVNVFPAKAHDHFQIPAGTIHCSGRNAMVLEISATPYIFTFKMWDWGRTGLDGQPRPVHLEHALANLQYERDTAWTVENLVNQTKTLAQGDGWTEERTGLNELEFIEVRRHKFTGPVAHDTHGTVNVVNLVAGSSAIVESQTGAFAPFTVHYAETFIIPAAVGSYTIRPGLDAEGELMTVKVYVRGTERTS